MDISKTMITLDTDTSLFNQRLDMMSVVRKDLQAQLPLRIFRNGLVEHIFPTSKLGMSSDKFRELLTIDFLAAFDSAFIKHSLEGLKTRVFFDEAIGQ
jgi:hypothetical protein